MKTEFDIVQSQMEKIEELAKEYGSNDRALQHLLDIAFIKIDECDELRQLIGDLAVKIVEIKQKNEEGEPVYNIRGEIIRYKRG